MVTSAELDRLRRLNFGHRTLRSEIHADVVAGEIARYDAVDAAEVSRRIRAMGGFELMLHELEALYSEVVDEYRAAPQTDMHAELQAASRYLHWLTQRLNAEQLATTHSPVRRVGKYLRRVPFLGRMARSIDRHLFTARPR